MNRKIITLLIIGSMTPVSYGLVPVVDTLAVAKSIEHQAETVLQWKQQYEQMTHQLEALKTQSQALTGNRGMGSVGNNLSFDQPMPQDITNRYRLIESQGLAGLSPEARALYDAYPSSNPCQSMATTEAKKACEARIARGFENQAMVLRGLQTTQRRMQQLDLLKQHINQTEDVKAMSELQGRIGIEQAAILEEQTQLNWMMALVQQEEQQAAYREHVLEGRVWASTKGITPKPIHFNQP